jgi:hypothetical protein
MERRGAYRVLVGKLEGMSPLGSKSNPVTGPEEGRGIALLF